MSSRETVVHLFTLCDVGVGDDKLIQLYSQRRMKQSCLSSKESKYITLLKVQDVLEVSSCWQNAEARWGRALIATGGNRNTCIGTLLYYRPTPCKGKELMRNQYVQILFPSALGPRATTQSGINWDYGGFGRLAATQGWMLNLCLSDLDSAAWLNWLTQAIVCQGLAFQKRGYRWSFYVTDF